jgi:sulfatase modifying factor 1
MHPSRCKEVWFGTLWLGTVCAVLLACLAQAAPSCPSEGAVEVNGVRLQYLDWGGSGPPVILVHGLADNPYAFDDLVPGLTDRFHVVAYSRRGSPGSDEKGPYDVSTLTEDLRSLMDALGISKANLIGASAGGDEVTEMAIKHPERVGHLIYYDGGYDWGDPDFRVLVGAMPASFFSPPESALISLGAYFSYEKSTQFPDVADISRLDTYLRQKVILQPNGSLKARMPKTVVDALYAALWANPPRDYARLHAPTLAIYAEHLVDIEGTDPERRKAVLEFERRYWLPFQEKSITRLQREVPSVRMIRLPGAHGAFLFTDRQQVLDITRGFLLGANPSPDSAAPGTRFRECTGCPDMMVVPSGHYIMGRKVPYDGRDDGDPEGVEKSAPAHPVSIDRPFALGVFDVTVAQYAMFVRDTGRSVERGCYVWNGDQWVDDRRRSWQDPGFRQTGQDPVVCVSQDDAKAYVGWLNSRVIRSPTAINIPVVSEPYRLPSWDEAEYAAGAGSSTPYYWGVEPLREHANYGANSCDPCKPAEEGRDRWRYTSPVGSFPPNSFGLYDMAGNVWQWTEDCVHRSPGGLEWGQAAASAPCTSAPVRGGSWLTSPVYLRVADYSIDMRINHNSTIGFRVARTLE